MNDLKTYFPKIYEGVVETDALIETENRLFEEAEAQTNKLLNNQFVPTSDTEGIEAFENMLQIIPNPATEDLAFRRQRVINRFSLSPPFSEEFLHEQLDLIIGQEKWTCIVDNQNYTLTIESSAEDQTYYHELQVLIHKVKPVNIIFINKPKIADNILTNESINLSELTFNYKLGLTWYLGTMPFASVQDKGVIKMGSISSIKQKLLNNLANSVVSNVAKVRLNNTLIITEFSTKAATNSTVTVEYQVEKTDGINEVTLVELLDVSNNVLSSAKIYVPVLEGIVLKHTIAVKEG